MDVYLYIKSELNQVKAASVNNGVVCIRPVIKPLIPYIDRIFKLPNLFWMMPFYLIVE